MESRVLQENFWKGRLEEASERGFEHLYESVYVTPKEDWEYIFDSHRDTITRLGANNGKILDAACGYGRMSELFDDYVGVDICQAFVDRAKQLYPQKQFIRTDITKGLPFAYNYFDWAICVSLKEMLIREVSEDYWLLVLKELKRVAKRVLILEYSSPREYEIL